MSYQLASCKKVIAQFYRDYKPSNSGFVDDAIEWIGEAIDFMKCGIQYVEDYEDIDVVDYKIKVRDCWEEILAIKYQGYRLRRNDGIRSKYSSSCESAYGSHSYKRNGQYVETTFETGCVRVYYLKFPVDCDGYPLVLDDAKYRQALGWFILMKMCSRGFKHPVFNYPAARSEWETAYPKAQNAARFLRLDTDGMENFKYHYVGLVKNLNRADEFYRTNGAVYDSGAFAPGTNLQSVQVLGTHTNEESSSSSVEIEDQL